MMKYIFAALLVLSSMSFGQSREGVKPKMSALVLNDSVATSATYANSQRDTTQAINTGEFYETSILLKAVDSIDVSVRYMPSFDGVTFAPEVTVASFTSVVAAGNVLAIQLPAGANACPYVKVVLVFNSSGNGVTTPLYSARVVQK